MSTTEMHTTQLCTVVHCPSAYTQMHAFKSAGEADNWEL